VRGKLRGDQAPAAPIGKSPDTARSRGTHFGRHNQDTKDGDLAAPSGAYRHRVRQRGADNPRCTMADPDDDELRALFTDDTPPQGWLAMLEATLAYGVSRQTLLQRVKRG